MDQLRALCPNAEHDLAMIKRASRGARERLAAHERRVTIAAACVDDKMRAVQRQLKQYQRELELYQQAWDEEDLALSGRLLCPQDTRTMRP